MARPAVRRHVLGTRISCRGLIPTVNYSIAVRYSKRDCRRIGLAITPLPVEASRFPFRLPDLVQYVPEGSPLPANVWLARHRAILCLVWIQAFALFWYSMVSGFGVSHSFFES